MLLQTELVFSKLILISFFCFCSVINYQVLVIIKFSFLFITSVWFRYYPVGHPMKICHAGIFFPLWIAWHIFILSFILAQKNTLKKRNLRSAINHASCVYAYQISSVWIDLFHIDRHRDQYQLCLKIEK